MPGYSDRPMNRHERRDFARFDDIPDDLKKAEYRAPRLMDSRCCCFADYLKEKAFQIRAEDCCSSPGDLDDV
jgi:hypothetical protein